MRPLRKLGDAGKPSPSSAEMMPPPPPPKRLASHASSSDAGSDAGSEATDRSFLSSTGSVLSWSVASSSGPPPPPHETCGDWLAALAITSPDCACASASVASGVGSATLFASECCIWCFGAVDGATQCPDRCTARIFPSKSAWRATNECRRLEQPTKTRGAAVAASGKVAAAQGRKQTARSASEQAAYDRAYHKWYSAELRSLAKQAARRLTAWLSRVNEPLRARDPSGVYSDVEMLKLDFISHLPTKVRPELLARGSSVAKLNNSASQLFAAEVKRVEPFVGGIASARLPGELADTDFAIEFSRYSRVPAFRQEVDEKLGAWKLQLRHRHGNRAAVKALPPSATLLDIFVACTAARGRPPNADAKPASKAHVHEKKETYSGATGFKGSYLEESTDYGARMVNSSLKNIKGDVLGALSQHFTNVSVDNATGRKQKNKSIHEAATSTKKGHAKDMAQCTRLASALHGPRDSKHDPRACSHA